MKTVYRNILVMACLVTLIPTQACAKQPPAPSATPPMVAATQATTRSPIGMNLTGIQSWNTAFPFLDIFKSATPWVSGTLEVWNDERRINLDEHGWVKSLAPGQVVHSVFIDATTGHVPAGQYVVTYEGEGEIVYQEGARLVEHAPGRDVIEVDPRQGNCYLDIVSVNTRNYIRNIRILLPGARAGETFNPVWIERIKHFKTLRLMGWMVSADPNQIGQQAWSERPMLADAHWSEKGVPLEVMLDLANLIGADPWFSIPDRADDDYVRCFAEVVRDRLGPGRKAYVEYSNEIWNNFFTSYAHVTKRGLELGLSTDPDEARARYQVHRSREIFAIFEEVLGGRDRLVRVLSGQQDGDPSNVEQMLAYNDASKHIDVFAIGAYFGTELGGPETVERLRRMTVDDLFREIETVSLPTAIKYARENAAMAARYHVLVVAYEGGQHLSPTLHGVDDPAIDALFDQAQRDPRMGRMYTRLLEEWSATTNGGLFLHLDECGRLGPYGRWGLLEYIDQPREEAPKYDAVMKWMEAAP